MILLEILQADLEVKLSGTSNDVLAGFLDNALKQRILKSVKFPESQEFSCLSHINASETNIVHYVVRITSQIFIIRNFFIDITNIKETSSLPVP